jgi:hypothetical protein
LLFIIYYSRILKKVLSSINISVPRETLENLTPPETPGHQNSDFNRPGETPGHQNSDFNIQAQDSTVYMNEYGVLQLVMKSNPTHTMNWSVCIL